MWKAPELLEQAGASKVLITQYGISYVCTKCATLLFVAQAYIPWASGCTDKTIYFDGSADMDPSVKCTLCYPFEGGDVSAGCRNVTLEDGVYYDCSVSCTTLFFSGAGTASYSLSMFVIAPLMWLPFTVYYANNEVAQLIDGVWWQHQEEVAAMSQSTKTRIGLSTTAHGYDTIAPLVHAVTITCACALLFILVTSRDAGYYVTVPPELMRVAEGESIRKSLHRAGHFVTWVIVLLNFSMVCRIVYELWTTTGSQAAKYVAGALQRTFSPRESMLLELLPATTQHGINGTTIAKTSSSPRIQGMDSVAVTFLLRVCKNEHVPQDRDLSVDARSLAELNTAVGTELGLGANFCILIFDADFDEFCSLEFCTLAFCDIPQAGAIVKMVPQANLLQTAQSDVFN